MILLFLIFSLFASGFADNECPNGWLFDHSTNDCYFFSTRLFNFVDVNQYCQSIGGTTVSIKSYTENYALTGEKSLNFRHSPILQCYNHGVRRNTTTGTFYNTDGSYFYSSMWTANEPSVNGDCATYKGTNPPGLQVTHCYQLQPALCRQTPALCNGGVFGGNTTRSGAIQSPGWPVQYYNNLRCQYLINSPNGTYITIAFDPFLIEEWYDSVTLYEGNRTTLPYWLGQPSKWGKNTYESQSNQLTIVFNTDASHTDRGWVANWSAKKSMPIISQYGNNGTMTSPNYPGLYDAYDEQVYRISVYYATQINITIDDFNTETRFDYLNVYNSTTQSNSTLVATLSGSSVAPWNWISPGSSASLKFVSDGSYQKKGFHLTWNMV